MLVHKSRQCAPALHTSSYNTPLDPSSSKILHTHSTESQIPFIKLQSQPASRASLSLSLAIAIEIKIEAPAYTEKLGRGHPR